MLPGPVSVEDAYAAFLVSTYTSRRGGSAFANFFEGTQYVVAVQRAKEVNL
jgi:hypothetical protein